MPVGRLFHEKSRTINEQKQTQGTEKQDEFLQYVINCDGKSGLVYDIGFQPGGNHCDCQDTMGGPFSAVHIKTPFVCNSPAVVTETTFFSV